MIRTTITGLVLGALVSLAVPAAAENVPAMFESPNALGSHVKGTQRLNSGAITAVDVERMGLVFLSGEGRYAVVGDVYDLWQGKKLKSLEEIRQSADVVRLDRLMDIADLAPISFGRGGDRVTIFADPLDSDSKAVLSKMQSLGDAYTFDVLVLPLRGKKAQGVARELLCAQDPAAAKAKLLSGSEAALAQTTGCSPLPLQKRLITAKMIGVREVPTVIAPDGRTAWRAPADLARFLAGDQP